MKIENKFMNEILVNQKRSRLWMPSSAGVFLKKRGDYQRDHVIDKP